MTQALQALGVTMAKRQAQEPLLMPSTACISRDILKAEEHLSGDVAQRQYGNHRCHVCSNPRNQYSYSGCVILTLCKARVQTL